MRVIAGEYKGRKLESPLGNDVRPTGDKVREAIFSSLAEEVPEALCVDLFAGTGALGIEALSRGARLVYFGDNSQDSMDLVKKNCRICGCSNDSIFFLGDWRKVLQRISKEAAGRVNLVFLDPPYYDGLLEKVLAQIDQLHLLAEGGIVMAEHPKDVELPQQIGDLTAVKERKYGKVLVTYYARTSL